MKTGNLKLIGLLALMVAFVLALTGCDAFQDTDSGVDPAQGLRITVNVPDNLVKEAEEVGILSIENFIKMSEIKVTIDSEEVDPLIEEKEIAEEVKGEYTVTIPDVIAHHEYDVKVELIGSIRNSNDDLTLYEGTGRTPKVEPDAIVETQVDVKPLDAQKVSVSLNEADEEDNVLDTLEKVILWHPADEIKYINEETPFNDGDVVEFENNFKPSRWHLILDFGEDRTDPIEFLLLPTEEKDITLEISYERGEIKVISDIHESPDKPENLNIEDGKLVWDEVGGASHYTVLRDGKYERYEPVETVEENSFLLLGVEPGTYYVRAYVDGYSSEKSEGIEIEKEQIPEGAYSSYDGEIYGSIQEAIDSFGNPADNPYVLVGPGTYQENVEVNVEGLTLKSIVEHGAVIDAGYNGLGIQISGENLGDIFIEGFKVKEWEIGGIGQGMGDREGTTPHILNNKIVGFEEVTQHGNSIQITGDNSQVIGNEVQVRFMDSEKWSATGILIFGASNTTVKDNYIYGGCDDRGIGIDGDDHGVPIASGNMVKGNIIEGCKMGITIGSGSEETNVNNNEFFDNRFHVINNSEEDILGNILGNNTFPQEAMKIDNTIQDAEVLQTESISLECGNNLEISVIYYHYDGWVEWCFDYPIDKWDGDGNVGVNVVIGMNNEIKYQIHNNDGVPGEGKFEVGDWLYSEYDEGWHTGDEDKNIAIEEKDGFEAIGKAKEGDEEFIVRISADKLGSEFLWASRPTVASGFDTPTQYLSTPEDFEWSDQDTTNFHQITIDY